MQAMRGWSRSLGLVLLAAVPASCTDEPSYTYTVSVSTTGSIHVGALVGPGQQQGPGEHDVHVVFHSAEAVAAFQTFQLWTTIGPGHDSRSTETPASCFYDPHIVEVTDTFHIDFSAGQLTGDREAQCTFDDGTSTLMPL